MGDEEEEMFNTLTSYKDNLLSIGLIHAQNIGIECDWSSACPRNQIHGRKATCNELSTVEGIVIYGYHEPPTLLHQEHPMTCQTF
jgi:hypothetical protein